MNHTDTIAAISTPLGAGGIGVIRISGTDAILISDKIFVGRTKICETKSHTILYGHIVCDTEKIDEVLVSVFHSPRSYTTEDVVEIHSHGGLYVMQRILSLLFENGVRPAEPGEFTKRAFLGGRIDLSQAESVMDIISAENERFLKNSERQLNGVLSEKVRALRADILHEIAFIEAALDDPEHYDLDGYANQLQEKLLDWKRPLSNWIHSAEDGRLLKEGIRTVIVGKPNVGKSSLLNAFTKTDRAIVTDIPGTTRDTLEEHVRIKDLSLMIVDTAGIRQSEDMIEKIGIDRALSSAADADLILYVIDASQDLDDNDYRIIETINLTKTIILLNKSDRDTIVDEKAVLSLAEKNGNQSSIPFRDIISISAKEQTGLDDLYERISDMFFAGNIEKNDDLIITNLRHKNLFIQADRSLSMVETSICDGQPEDFFSIDLMDAYTSLGEIIGEEVGDDLVEEIFSKFCMGK